MDAETRKGILWLGIATIITGQIFAFIGLYLIGLGPSFMVVVGVAATLWGAGIAAASIADSAPPKP